MGKNDAEASAGRWTVRSIWVGPRLTELEWASLTSFVRHGARFELFTDDMARQVPAGVVLRHCRDVIGDRLLRYGPRAGEGNGSLAMSADVARLCTLTKEGGWWVDTDVICLKPFTPIDHGVQVAWEDLGRLTDGVANVAVMRLPAGSSVARILYRRVRFPWFGSPWDKPLRRLRNFKWLFDTIRDPCNVPWGWSAGPEALTAAIDYVGLRDGVLPPVAFYPVHSLEWASVLTMSPDAFTAMAKDSYAVHLWAEMYRRGGLDKGEAIRKAPWAKPYLSDFPG